MNRDQISRVVTSLLLSVALLCAQSTRYRQLRLVIDRNTDFARATRGVNMYTLYALRGCITERDIPVLRDLLRDRDRIIRLAVSSVLADLGTEGKTVIQVRLSEVTDAREKLMLQESLDTVGRSGYRQILQYPLTDAERGRIRGCN